MLIVAPESTFLVFKSSTVPVINPVCCENTGLQINKATIIKRYLSVNFNGFKGEQDSLQIYHFHQDHRIPILLIRIKPNLRYQSEPIIPAQPLPTHNKGLNTDEATGLLRVVIDYAYALDILDKYDHQQLIIEGTTAEQLFVINYAEAKQAIHDLKDKFGGSSLFGNEKDQSFKSSIVTIYQTFNGIDLIRV